MGKTCFLLTVLLFWGLRGLSQFEYFGSPPTLKEQLQSSLHDTTKLRLYVQLSNSYVFSKPDSAFQYAQKGLTLATRIDNQKWIAYNSLSLAQSFIVMSNFPMAIEVALRTLPIFEKQNDTVGITFSNLILSWAQRDAGDARRAVPFARNAMHYASAKKDLFSLLIACEHLTGEYHQLKKLDSALFYGKQVLKLQQTVQSPWQGFYRTIAMVYFEMKQYELALKYYRMTIAPSLNAGVLFDVLDAYTGMAEVYRQMGNLDSSTFYAHKALNEFKEVPKLDARLKAASILAETYQQNNSADKALKYTKLSIAFKDSLASQEKVKAIQNIFLSERFRQQELLQQQTAYKNKVRTYVLMGGLAVLLLIAGQLWRNNRHKQKVNALLQRQKQETERAYNQLKATQAQLIQREKMASLGELTAGIAHEIQNPLNFVYNFSETNKELSEELTQELDNGNLDAAKLLARDIADNEVKIAHHGKRADSIVKSMLQHACASTGKKEPTNINQLADEYLRLAYQGSRAKDNTFTVHLQTSFDETIGQVTMVPQEIGRVLLNLYTNAFYAVQEKKRQLNGTFEPSVRVSTKKAGNKVLIIVSDNGTGIPPKNLSKIYQPFFTTKPAGEGTGLGLSLSYDIVSKGHGGELDVETKVGDGTTFVIRLPFSTTNHIQPGTA